MKRDFFWEKTIKTEEIYRGRVVNLRKDDVTLPNGRTSTREIVEHPGAVVILAESNPGKIMMVKQFRKPVEEILWELPAGTVEPSERMINCARRELEEETGYQAKTWERVYQFYSAPGFCNESLVLYFAQNLTKTNQNTDHDEFIQVIEIDKEKARSLLEKKQIRDAKTLIGILWWLHR